MSGFNQNLLTEIAGAFGFGNPYLRDYTHASKTFRTNSYQNSPKFKFLFHTYFEINPVLGDANYGLLVREIKLPAFSFNTTQLNQYNRKRIIQSKIKYEPIEISFHDDNANQATKLWESYYTYYYNDANKPGSVLSGSRGGPENIGTKNYNDRNIYNSSISGDDDWGFAGGQTSDSGIKPSFFKNITVFGFNQHEFTAYTLINPVITNFSHDSYNYSEVTGSMTNRMTIDYETVVYNYGTIDGRSPENIVTGFGDNATYDTQLSPIASPAANGVVLGKGGLVDAAGGAIKSIKSGDAVGAVRAAGAIYNGLPNVNLNTEIKGILNSLLVTSLQNVPINRNTMFSVPSAATSPGPNGLAGSTTIGALAKPPSVDANTTYAGSQYSGPPSVFREFPPFNPD